MIGVNTLEKLLEKYGIDTTKVLNKNNNILEYGEYQDIDRTLNYLINELHISGKNIEKCPSIMYYGVSNIKENYDFLIKSKINISNIETTLHILSTDPKDLKETYDYLIDNYGIEYINRNTSVLRAPLVRIKQIEALLNDKSLILSAATSKRNIDEIKENILVCKKNNIPLTGSVFLKTPEEIEKIVEVCEKYNIPLTGSVFYKTSEEIDKIVEVCKNNNIPITGSVFLKTSEEIEKIDEVCKRYNIPITGSVFQKTSEEIEKSAKYVKDTYGDEYLVPLIVNKNVKHLQTVLPYLESLGVLQNIIESASILTLTIEEIEERKQFIESKGETLVLPNGRFNSVFGLSRANYKKLNNKTLTKKLNHV